MHKSPTHCMTRQKCKSTGKRHIARARSEQCTLPLQANMQHPAELPQRGDADLSLARRQDMKVPHGQPRWPQPTKTRKRDAPTSPPWTRCRCCHRSRQRPGCATGPSRWGPLMLPFGLGSKAHLSCGRPQTSEVMAVKLDSFTEAGGRGLQGGSAGKPAHLAAVEVPRRGPVRPAAVVGPNEVNELAGAALLTLSSAEAVLGKVSFGSLLTATSIYEYKVRVRKRYKKDGDEGGWGDWCASRWGNGVLPRRAHPARARFFPIVRDANARREGVENNRRCDEATRRRNLSAGGDTSPIFVAGGSIFPFFFFPTHCVVCNPRPCHPFFFPSVFFLDHFVCCVSTTCLPSLSLCPTPKEDTDTHTHYKHRQARTTKSKHRHNRSPPFPCVPLPSTPLA